MKNKLTIYAIITVTIFTLLTEASSCKKFLAIDPPINSISSDNVYQNDNTAASVITGIYATMMGSDFTGGGITSTSLLMELSSDNLVLFDINKVNYLAYYRNQLDPADNNTKSFGNGDYWTNLYPRIYTINAAIEGIGKSSSISNIKKRLLGETYFLRAFYYFYLVNLYGDIPIVLTTDYTKNASIERSSVDAVYKQIVADLETSLGDMDDNYLDGTISKTTVDRLRPNLATVQSLLARVELYRKNYAVAEKYATAVIDKTTLYTLLPPDKVFLKNSMETIWALQPVKAGYNTDEAAVYLLTSAPGNGNKIFYASSPLMNSFENGDLRKRNWTGLFNTNLQSYPFIAKYKADVNSSSVTEYCIVFRIAEQYLIRAEARAAQGNISGALDDLNAVRRRSGLSPIPSSTASTITSQILQERRVELFCEWGHRWFDLKRSGTIDATMQMAQTYKGGTWQPYQSLLPVPNVEMLLNKNLTQNTGY
ncbi:RagB/SusD family nutrient uptake outer membrane protein [Chitinophaga varians]|uniref:RagB/SusD family nutrient uptake outer membrane protein n=1 Tax=Chitinophaga varians TaxID=2202339 RepID=UPI00165F40E6|nr:RagB/SusD family nutrient uptake outer membrane protein [Chitinophaga varians]MBC9915095.1 RagB/SusD family nutrient uptake outer membrane protein [Chitinophaga varians]